MYKLKHIMSKGTLTTLKSILCVVSMHKNVPFGGCLIKIFPKLSILHRLNPGLRFNSVLKLSVFFLDGTSQYVTLRYLVFNYQL